MTDQIKYTFIIAIIVMIMFIAFIITLVVLYSKKQLIYFKEKELLESEHENQLLQIKLDRISKN